MCHILAQRAGLAARGTPRADTRGRARAGRQCRRSMCGPPQTHVWSVSEAITVFWVHATPNAETVYDTTASMQ